MSQAEFPAQQPYQPQVQAQPAPQAQPQGFYQPPQAQPAPAQPAPAPAPAPAYGGGYAQPGQPAPRREANLAAYAGIAPADSREPEPEPGNYHFQITAIQEWTSRNPVRPQGTEYFKAVFTVLESSGATPVGATVCFFQSKNLMGVQSIKSFLLAASGLSLAEFDRRAEVGELQTSALIGRRVLATVSAGKAVPSKPGEYYREWSWTVAA